MLRERKVDLLLLDLLMPEMGGRELILKLRADPKLRHVPVIVVTAAVEQRIEREVRPVAQAWLLKSALSLSQLADQIAGQLAAARGTSHSIPALGGVPAPMPPGLPPDTIR